ncbi:MAG: FixH family protein [Candidatus Entotheonellia bacterium]
MRRQAEPPKRRQPSRGALGGLTIAVIAVGWLVYSFVGELAPPPATQWVGDLEISLYSTLTGRPRVGNNQFEVKLRDRQRQPVPQAAVEVAYSMGSMGHGSRVVTRPEGYGVFSTMLSFPMAGTWNVEVLVRRPGRPEVKVPFSLRVQ